MKSLKIILLFDLCLDIPLDQYPKYFKTSEWKPEKDIKTALMNLGHTVIPFGLFNNIQPFVKLLIDEKPDLVFNMSEAFNNQRELEPNLTALLQLFKIPFTGSSPATLQLCKDKGVTKMILNHHNIKTPDFVVAKKDMPIQNLKNFKFPGFVKPLNLESSEGISKGSYVQNESEAAARIKFIHTSLNADAIIEEFIDGKEVYVSILGNDKLTSFPVRELFFKQMDDNQPKFATYKSKWDLGYRKKWGIDTDWLQDLPQITEKRLINTCKTIYKLLNIEGYGRIDLRIKDNQFYFIEANPNPSIASKEDFALSAKKGGLPFEELISKIVHLAMQSKDKTEIKADIKSA